MVITAAGAVLVMAAAACSGLGTSKPPQAAQVTITPGSGAHGVSPSAGVTVTVAHGKLRNVVVQDVGDPLSGQLSLKDTVWHSDGLLNPSHTYTVTATTVGAGNKKVVVTSSFRVLKPRKTFTATIIEGYKQSYGVGMPVVLTLNRPITHRAAVERSLSLRTSKPVEGAWYWDGNRTVEFRPRVYWPAHTTVSVNGRFTGVEGAKGVYGVRNLHQKFSIGSSLIVVASTASHYMQVYYKHKLFGDWPMGTGQARQQQGQRDLPDHREGQPDVHEGARLRALGALGRPVHLERRLHPRCLLVGGAAGLCQRQPRLREHLQPPHAETYYNMELPGDPVRNRYQQSRRRNLG